ncbi:MAG: HlyD family type I secretion periplasmic adaptor subunit [Pseudomonadota bacterium]
MNDHANTADLLDEQLPVAPARAAIVFLYLVTGLIVVALIWAATAKLDMVTRGQGRVVPSTRLQEVQYLEGGIIKEILVAPGDEVAKGQLLVSLDPKQMNAEFLQGRDSANALRARIKRLEAEAANEPLVYGSTLERQAPDIVRKELALYEARRQERQSQLSVEQNKVRDAEAAAEIANRAFDLATEELELVEPLVKKGIEPRIELIRARQRRASAEGDLQRAEIAVERSKAELATATQNLKTAIVDELAKAKAEQTGFSGELPALRDKIDRTEVRSPIAGIVNRVLVSTQGGVAAPGETLVEIVPHGETPLIKARIKPADIGFLKVGQSARVRLTAYDSAIYGALDAVIETVSPDAIEDEKSGESYFEILVRTQSVALRRGDAVLPISPGMAAEVDVLNGKRTVLSYLFSPLAKVSNKAFRES